MDVRVYTDGSSSPHHQVGGPGGWSAILFVDGIAVDGVYGGAKPATNNQMELRGLIEGMKLLPLIERLRCADCGIVAGLCEYQEACPIKGKIMRPVYEDARVFSDSQYCVNGANSWVHGWKGNGWKTKDKKPVKNRELWEEVDKATRRACCSFHWVKGHNGDYGNELADLWAMRGKQAMYGNPSQNFWAKIPGIGED